MDIILRRNYKRKDGIFGTLLGPMDLFLCYTLEHSDENCEPIVPRGAFQCVRGIHSLKHSLHPFETFEVKGVPGHSGILFHVGNYNQDTAGCILVGQEILKTGAVWSISHSRLAFEQQLMTIQKALNKFELVVEEAYELDTTKLE